MTIIKHGTFRENSSNAGPRQSMPRPGARVITVTSGKGGVGKTNVTINLALALAESGLRVIIFDADLGLSNVDVLLGITPHYNLHDHLYRQVPLEQVLFPGPGGIKIISGGSGFLELANLNARQRTSLLQGLEQMDLWADYILIDTGAGISKDVLAFCAAADDVLVVITPEPTSLTDAYGLIKVLDKFKLHQKASFVINQSRHEQEAINTARRLIGVAKNYLTIDVSYLGCILYDGLIVQAVKNQTPFLLAYPKSKPARAIQKIALSMVDVTNMAVLGQVNQTNQVEVGLKGFLHKLGKLFK